MAGSFNGRQQPCRHNAAAAAAAGGAPDAKVQHAQGRVPQRHEGRVCPEQLLLAAGCGLLSSCRGVQTLLHRPQIQPVCCPARPSDSSTQAATALSAAAAQSDAGTFPPSNQTLHHERHAAQHVAHLTSCGSAVPSCIVWLLTSFSCWRRLTCRWGRATLSTSTPVCCPVAPSPQPGPEAGLPCLAACRLVRKARPAL